MVKHTVLYLPITDPEMINRQVTDVKRVELSVLAQHAQFASVKVADLSL